MHRDSNGDYIMYYSRQGEPISMEEWAAIMAEGRSEKGWEATKRVARTTVGEWEVSTVWLGLDHSFMEDSPPLIFETMIFGGEWDTECWRYSTEAEALEGHQEAVKLLQLDLAAMEADHGC